jgi:hypothetical protein
MGWLDRNRVVGRFLATDNILLKSIYYIKSRVSCCPRATKYFIFLFILY